MKNFCVERDIVDHKNYYGGVKVKKTYIESESEIAARRKFLVDLLEESFEKENSVYFKTLDGRLHSIIFGEDNNKLVEGSNYTIFECNEKVPF